ncbi:MAG: MFS transporter [Anaerolineaceae bacterium]|nr:MFS transporter [Anaerolineaceae bacterium]
MQTDNKQEIGSVEFIVLVAFIMLLTAVAIDIMLPAFGDLRVYLGLPVDSTATAQIVTFFFMGQVGQLAFGPLADRYGRLPVMRTGFLLYIGGCIAAAFSPSLTPILIARFIVGLGAAALSVGAVTSVRDRFSGDKMARTMSLIMTIFLFVPVIAPIAGTFILSVSSWHVVFLTPALVGIGVFIWSFRLRESLPPEGRLNLDMATLAQSARQVLGNTVFVRYTLIVTILFSAFSSYVSSSEHMISEIYGRPEVFTLIFGGIGIVMAIFTFLNSRLVERFGARRTVRSLLTVYFVLALFLLILTLALQGKPNLFVFFAIIALLQGIYVAAEPNSSALALEPLGSTAGMAAAIYGTSFFVVGSFLGSFIDRQLVGSVTPLAVGYVVSSMVAVMLVFSGRTSTKPVVMNSETVGQMGD